MRCLLMCVERARGAPVHLSPQRTCPAETNDVNFARDCGGIAVAVRHATTQREFFLPNLPATRFQHGAGHQSWWTALLEIRRGRRRVRDDPVEVGSVDAGRSA